MDGNETGVPRLGPSSPEPPSGLEPLAGDPPWLSEARYQAIVEDQPDLVCRFLPDGTLTFANSAYCTFLGVRREEIVGKRYQPVVHPDDVAAVQAQVDSLTREQPVVFIVNRVFRADGAVRWTEWSNRALYDDSGRLVELQSTGRDITDRKAAEQATARLAAIVASADDAIYATSLDGVVTSWNRAAERMFGYSTAEAIGRPISLIVPAGDSVEALENVARVRGGETIQHIEMEKVHWQLRIRRTCPAGVCWSSTTTARRWSSSARSWSDAALRYPLQDRLPKPLRPCARRLPTCSSATSACQSRMDTI